MRVARRRRRSRARLRHGRGGSPAALSRIAHGATRAIVNRDLQPTAGFVIDGDIDFEASQMEQRDVAAAGADDVDFVAATRLATALIGDSIATNLFMLGYAFQKGWVPLGPTRSSARSSSTASPSMSSKRTFAWGRLRGARSGAASRRRARLHDSAAPPRRRVSLRSSSIARSFSPRTRMRPMRSATARSSPRSPKPSDACERAQRTRRGGARTLCSS